MIGLVQDGEALSARHHYGLRQRPNTVSLSPQGTGCEMEVQSNYSGFEHNDAGNFTKCVNESLATGKETTPAEAAKPADAK
jgi:hypothetical protein